MSASVVDCTPAPSLRMRFIASIAGKSTHVPLNPFYPEIVIQILVWYPVVILLQRIKWIFGICTFGECRKVLHPVRERTNYRVGPVGTAKAPSFHLVFG